MSLTLNIPASTRFELQAAPLAVMQEVRRGARWYLPQPVSVATAAGRKLTSDYWCILDGVLLRIPAGYEWDGASIPRWAWWIVGHPFDVRHEAAGLIHDWLYGNKAVPRGQADLVLHDVIARTRGYCPGWRQNLHANVFWSAVRVGGWWPWVRKDSERVAAQRKQFIWWSQEVLRHERVDWESRQTDKEQEADDEAERETE